MCVVRELGMLSASRWTLPPHPSRCELAQASLLLRTTLIDVVSPLLNAACLSRACAPAALPHV
jgi:hypothetical protein